MTDLLNRPTSRQLPPPAPRGGAPARRPPWSPLRSSSTRAAAAAVVAAGSGLLVLWVVALAGWYASDGGGHGSSTAALRIGTDAWLLGHGSGLSLSHAAVTAVPLGITALCAVLCLRSACLAASEDVPDLRSAGHAAAIFAGTYAVLAGGAALLAQDGVAAPSAIRATTGALLLAGVAGVAGVVRGAGLRPRVRSWLPVEVRSTAYGAWCAVLATGACAAAVVLASLARHGAGAARVVEQLHGGVSGAVFTVLLSLVLLPNAVGLTCSWLLGPGFAVGAGTVVAPSAVLLGRVPAVPLLAALPATGSPSRWFDVVLLLPLLAGGWGAWRAGRRLPTVSWVQGALRGVATGVVAALGLTFVAAVSGGSVGPGRMAVVGAPLGEVFLLALAAFVGGGGIGGPAATWWARRSGVEEAEPVARPPLRPALAEVRGSVRRSCVDSLWASRPWSRPWREQFTLGEALPLDDDAGDTHLADEATVTVHLPDQPSRPS